MESCKNKNYPVKNCNASYRGPVCSSLRASAGVDYDPNLDRDEEASYVTKAAVTSLIHNLMIELNSGQLPSNRLFEEIRNLPVSSVSDELEEARNTIKHQLDILMHYGGETGLQKMQEYANKYCEILKDLSDAQNKDFNGSASGDTTEVTLKFSTEAYEQIEFGAECHEISVEEEIRNLILDGAKYRAEKYSQEIDEML